MIKIKKFLNEFQSLIKIVSNYSDETDFIFGKEGITVKAIHMSNISVCKIVINKSLFEEYDIDKEVTYTLKTDILVKMVKKIGKKEMTIRLEEDGLYINNLKDNFKLNYFVGLNDDRNIPEFKYSSEWVVNTTDFINSILDIKDFSEIFCLTDNGELTINVKANMVEGNTKIDAIALISVPNKTYYALEFIEKIGDIKTIFKDIMVRFATDTPCYIKGEQIGLTFEWILAPRINEDG